MKGDEIATENGPLVDSSRTSGRTALKQLLMTGMSGPAAFAAIGTLKSAAACVEVTGMSEQMYQKLIARLTDVVADEQVASAPSAVRSAEGDKAKKQAAREAILAVRQVAKRKGEETAKDGRGGSGPLSPNVRAKGWASKSLLPYRLFGSIFQCTEGNRPAKNCREMELTQGGRSRC
jgi:hypothetical protein